MAALRRSQRSIKVVQRFGSVVRTGDLTKEGLGHSISRKRKQNYALYLIEIKEIDPINRQAKVHYVGYSDKYDEWKDLDDNGDSDLPIIKCESLFLLSEETLPERITQFCYKMSLQVKRALWSSRRNYPEVRFEIPLDSDVYEKAFRIVGISYSFKKITGRLICKNEEMDHLLGHKWNVRVKNKFGDCEFVAEGTFCFWMKLRPPLDDFV